MNKYQEALDYFLNRDEGDNLTVTCDWLSNAEELQELVAKATPKKPINTIRCANCGGDKVKDYLTDIYGDFEGILNYNYCGDCGQKIDWSDEE